MNGNQARNGIDPADPIAAGPIDPVASYRVQLTPGEGFDHVVGLFDHFVALGVSHVYLSPIAEAVPGSSHGYDVVDHATVRAEFGGGPALDRLLDTAAARGLRVVIDHVPNHASTARPELNVPWWEMLSDGPTAPGARWFDVDWAAGDGRVVLPVLGAPLDDVLAAGDVVVVAGGADGAAELLVHGGLRLPLAAGTAGLAMPELLDRQHYRLVWWRDTARNVRRFFTIDDLVAVRAEVPEVAASLDVLPAELSSHPAFGGVRVDHVDGLADPAGYLAGLRARIGAGAWLVVEKILAADESLPAGWPVDGTTGYEFARLLDQVMVVPAALATFERLWADAASGDDRLDGDFGHIEDRARREVLAGGLRPDLERTVAAGVRALGELPGLADVLTELTVRLPRYRTYLPDDEAGAATLATVADAVRRELPDLAGTCDRVHDALSSPHAVAPGPGAGAVADLRTRWQQLTGPAMAKGAEDRAFFRYVRFASLCEVGGEPGRFGTTVDEFHVAQKAVQRSHPLTMLTGSTHDTKRSGDVRARAAALTAEHLAWAEAVDAWTPVAAEAVPGIDAAMVSLALQTAVTCPGLVPRRLAGFLTKSAREAELYTSWTEPDESYESLLIRLADVIVGGGEDGDVDDGAGVDGGAVGDGRVDGDGGASGDDRGLARAVGEWSARLDRPGRAAAVAATIVRCTAPGVPDVYQGDEAFAYRLVDPDNREPPDWERLGELVRSAATLDGPTAWSQQPETSKAVVIGRATALRRRQPDAVGRGGTYRRLAVTGTGADRVLAFARGDAIVTVVPLPGLDLARAGELFVELPPGTWVDVLADDSPPTSGHFSLVAALTAFPGVLLERRT